MRWTSPLSSNTCCQTPLTAQWWWWMGSSGQSCLMSQVRIRLFRLRRGIIHLPSTLSLILVPAIHCLLAHDSWSLAAPYTSLRLCDSHSSAAIPSSAYVGSIRSAASEQVAAHLGHISSQRGGHFAQLNGACATDACCIIVPPNVEVSAPIHVLYISTAAGGSGVEGTLSANAPRLLVVAGAGAAVELVEEYVSASQQASNSLTCAVAEVSVAESAQVVHGYVQVRGQRRMPHGLQLAFFTFWNWFAVVFLHARCLFG